MNEKPRGYQPSSHSYVSAWMKQAECDEDKGLQKLVIMKVRNCDHETTICVKCHDEWAQDYNLHYHRTIGGRILQEAIKSREAETGTELR